MPAPQTITRSKYNHPYIFILPFIIPVCFIISQLYLRFNAGAFWHWHLHDPTYFYLLDGLNLFNGKTPGHIYHPGITVHALNAILLGIYDFFTPGEIEKLVLTNPERLLNYFSNVAILLNALALAIVGIIGRYTFDNWLPPIVCQLAPFMSSIVLKHAFLPKPEALLVFSTCILISLSFCGRRDKQLILNTNSLAIMFGILGGFILATKITAFPILILAVFVLRKIKPIIIFACVLILAFLFFFLPAIEALGLFYDWIKRLSSSTGTHGGGTQGFILFDHYFDAFLKILKRPSLRVPLLLAIVALSVVGWRLKRRQSINLDDAWGLAGVSTAQITHVALVAKQATAFYMIPSYMLASLSILYSTRLLWSSKPISWKAPLKGSAVATLLISAFAVTQISSVNKLANYFYTLKQNASKADDKKFRNCARIYNYSASSPVFAMFLADYNTGLRFSRVLRNFLPENDYWINDWWGWKPITLRNWDGIKNLRSIITVYPCVYLRGTLRLGSENFLRKHIPELNTFKTCRAGAEIIRTLNIGCNGLSEP